jgi:hypothetical protein
MAKPPSKPLITPKFPTENRTYQASDGSVFDDLHAAEQQETKLAIYAFVHAELPVPADKAGIVGNFLIDNAETLARALAHVAGRQLEGEY